MSEDPMFNTPSDPVRRGPGRPRKVLPPLEPLPVASSAEPPRPAIQVTSRRSAALQRRLAPGANPHGGGSRTIPLREPHRWKLYLGNSWNNDDDLYRIVHELGWEPLEVSDLACKPEEIGFRVSPDGKLVRGAESREMLFKMAIEDYRLLEKRKTERNNAGIGRPSAIRAQTANAAAAAFGDEAGETVHRNFHGEVIDTLEPLPQ